MALDNRLAWRPANARDLDALFEVHQASVRELCAGAYSAQHIEQWFEGRSPQIYQPLLEQGNMWLAHVRERAVGFVGTTPGEIVSLFVAPDWAGQGLGSALLHRGLADASRRHPGPVTAVATLNAVGFYARHGFKRVDEGHFTRGVDRLAYPVVEMAHPGSSAASLSTTGA
jgi:predicted N-acetyltransferase YhbS